MNKEEVIEYFEKRKEKSLMLMEKSKADTPINNEVKGILTRKIEALDMAISALKDEWILIESEEKPEDYDRVLITINGCRGLIVREAQYHKAQNEFEVLHNHERWKVGEKGLLAWQPFPEPYKKGGK